MNKLMQIRQQQMQEAQQAHQQALKQQQQNEQDMAAFGKIVGGFINDAISDNDGSKGAVNDMPNDQTTFGSIGLSQTIPADYTNSSDFSSRFTGNYSLEKPEGVFDDLSPEALGDNLKYKFLFR